jgi:hypothetical protein
MIDVGGRDICFPLVETRGYKMIDVVISKVILIQID